MELHEHVHSVHQKASKRSGYAVMYKVDAVTEGGERE